MFYSPDERQNVSHLMFVCVCSTGLLDTLSRNHIAKLRNPAAHLPIPTYKQHTKITFYISFVILETNKEKQEQQQQQPQYFLSFLPPLLGRQNIK